MLGMDRWRVRAHVGPRLSLALKAAVAAALAWLAALPLDATSEAYRYYAPFGAVTAVTSTVASSVRGAAQLVAAIVTAVLITAAAELLALPTVASIAAVVAVGSFVGGHRRLGEMGAWVPSSALLVLIVAGDEPVQYVAAYLGLTTLGAAVGVLVNVLLPPLPLTATGLALRRLRAALAEELDRLADGLTECGAPTPEEWRHRRRRLDPSVAEMRRVVEHTAEARRGNWRARRWQETADHQYRHARALERLSGVVEDLDEVVAERESAEVAEVALGPDLRPVLARSLQSLAEVLRTTSDESHRADGWPGLEDRIEDLRGATRRAWREAEEDRFTAAALVVDLERATESLSTAGREQRDGWSQHGARRPGG